MMKQKILLITAIMLVAMIVKLPGQFSGGAGTAASPYQIANVRDLNNIRGASYLNKYFIQTNDIDLWATNKINVSAWNSSQSYAVGDYVRYNPGLMEYTYICIQANTNQVPSNTAFWTLMWESDKGWRPIGDSTEPFHGQYNGNGKYISNLYINRGASPVADTSYPSDGEDMVGLFGFVSNGSNTTGNNFDTVIRNVSLLDPNVRGRRGTGTLVGRVFLPYTLPARSYTAIVERNFARASSGTATVSGLGAVGGLVGSNNSEAKQRVPIVRYSYAYVTVSSTHPTNITRNPADPTGTSGINNPYNIKYGGLIGCNENGITLDSFARGNVSGGDRVGGLVGCTIGGAIFRSYSTGTVTQGIVPGNWEGGIGGLVGRTSGTLPPGLGGTTATGSCEDCYWDLQTSGFATSPGGTGLPTAQMKLQASFNNWDFVNIWGISPSINDGYPYLRGTASSVFYYRSLQTGNWNQTSSWQYSTDNLSWNAAVVTPDAGNSLAITIRNPHVITLTSGVIIDQTVIESGAVLRVANGVNLTLTNGSGDDLTNNGTLRLTGMLIPEVSSTMVSGIGSKLIFDGTTTQNPNAYFPTSFYDVEINNTAGVTFTNAITVNNVLSVLSGTYSNAGVVDGYYSPNVKNIDILPSGALISGFSVTMTTPSEMPDFVNRVWSINGTYSGSKTVTFYWTTADDSNFDWTGIVPAVFKGAAKYTGTYNVSGATRYITVVIPSSLSKADYRIGRNDDQTLPVELSGFTATINAVNYVQLSWITQSETNVSGFQIYRGKSMELSEAILLNAFVTATNTSQTQTYVFVDSELYEPGTYYYWLQNLDFDGSTAFHGPVSVIYGESIQNPSPSIPLASRLESIYPNPFNPSTTISYSVKDPSMVNLAIYNLRGQIVKNLSNESKQPGNYRLIWDGSSDNGQRVASGTYIVRLRIGDQAHSRRIILSK